MRNSNNGQCAASESWIASNCYCAFGAASENPGPAGNAALSASPGNFELLVQSVRDYAIFLLDLDGRVASWNAGAERSKGYHALQIIGQHFSCFYSCDDIAAGLPAHELELATRNGCYEDEGRRFRKDGSRFWARVSISALRDENGQLVGFGKVTRDLTEAVLPNEQFRLAIEATPTGMMMINEAGEIVLVNVQIERLFGYSRQELIGKPAMTLVPSVTSTASEFLQVVPNRRIQKPFGVQILRLTVQQILAENESGQRTAQSPARRPWQAALGCAWDATCFIGRLKRSIRKVDP